MVQAARPILKNSLGINGSKPAFIALSNPIKVLKYPTPKKNDDKGWRNLERTIYRILRKNEVSEAWSNTNYVRNKMRDEEMKYRTK